MTQKINLTIDGQEISAEESMSVLDAALANDIFIREKFGFCASII